VRFTLGKQSLKSKSVGSSSNPAFNEVLMLSWDGEARLRGVVYSTSVFGKDEEVGHVDVNLAERSSFENLPLQPSVTACFSRSVLFCFICISFSRCSSEFFAIRNPGPYSSR
jgi:hypothetical protein